MRNRMMDILRGGMCGVPLRRKPQQGRSRDVVFGDVVSVEGDILRRYGIWTGDDFILYGEDQRGREIVHRESFRDFLHGAEHLAICEFPETYGKPAEWEQPAHISSVVMPEDKIWRMLERAHKASRYRRYSPQETVRRAQSKLGTGGYATSEHFAMWCKTGIAESHELESIRDVFERMVVY